MNVWNFRQRQFLLSIASPHLRYCCAVRDAQGDQKSVVVVYQPFSVVQQCIQSSGESIARTESQLVGFVGISLSHSGKPRRRHVVVSDEWPRPFCLINSQRIDNTKTVKKTSESTKSSWTTRGNYCINFRGGFLIFSPELGNSAETMPIMDKCLRAA